MKEYKVIDNFLPEDVFSEMSREITSPGKFPLYYVDFIAFSKERNKFFYFEHPLFYRSRPTSDFYLPIVEPFLEGIGVNAIIRAKVNAYPKTESIEEHGKHVDFDNMPNDTAIFYINTNNGFTRLEDGTVVESVANRLLILDGAIYHNSSSCTDADLRFVLNLNFI